MPLLVTLPHSQSPRECAQSIEVYSLNMKHDLESLTRGYHHSIMQAKDADDEDELFAVDQRGPDPQAASHVLPDTGRSAASTPPVAGPDSSLLGDHEHAEDMFEGPTSNGATGERNREECQRARGLGLNLNSHSSSPLKSVVGSGHNCELWKYNNIRAQYLFAYYIMSEFQYLSNGGNFKFMAYFSQVFRQFER